LQVAADLAKDGVEVVAVVEGAASPFRAPAADIASLWGARPVLAWRGAGYLATLRRRGVPVLYRHVLIRIEGAERAERAFVAAIDETGAVVPGSERVFEVDAVCTGYGFAPSNEITRLLGCSHAADPRNGVTLVALHDQDGRTSVRDVFVAGDAGGPWGAHAAVHQGTLAGAAAAADLTGQNTQRSALVARARQGLGLEAVFQDALWRVFAMPRLGDRLAGDGTIACRCEDQAHDALRHGSLPGPLLLAVDRRHARSERGGAGRR
ncbi:MAG: FAD-dependent oxidoreductase, partial [Proteobacteria bacterium]|nr:FAD-dependent oxidoreductase [Pseudomonadota bacterium]